MLYLFQKGIYRRMIPEELERNKKDFCIIYSLRLILMPKMNSLCVHNGLILPFLSLYLLKASGLK